MFLFSLDKYLGVEFLGCMVVLFLIFWGMSILFSIVAAPTCSYFPPTGHKDFLFSTSWPTFMICDLLDARHSGQCEVISHCGFELHFLMINNAEHPFTCLLASCMSLKKFRSDPLPIFYCPCFNQAVCFLMLMCEIFVYFG